MADDMYFSRGSCQFGLSYSMRISPSETDEDTELVYVTSPSFIVCIVRASFDCLRLKFLTSRFPSKFR